MKNRILYRILVLTHRFANCIATAGWPGCERAIIADARGDAGFGKLPTITAHRF